MNSVIHNDHPDDITLDKLRAGLAFTGEDAIRSHVAGCEICQQRFAAWDRLAAEWRSHAPTEGALAVQLRERRRRALAGQGANPSTDRRWEPRHFALAAAIGVVAIGTSLFMTLDRFAVDTPAVSVSSQVERPADIYTDIDFYLWLANHGLAKDTNGNAS